MQDPWPAMLRGTAPGSFVSGRLDRQFESLSLRPLTEPAYSPREFVGIKPNLDCAQQSRQAQPGSRFAG